MKWVKISHTNAHTMFFIIFKYALYISITLYWIDFRKIWSVPKFRSWISYIDSLVLLCLSCVPDTKAALFVLHRTSSSGRMWIFIAKSWTRKSRSHPRRKMLKFRGSSLLPTVSCTSAWMTFRYLQGSPHLDCRIFLAHSCFSNLFTIFICFMFVSEQKMKTWSWKPKMNSCRKIWRSRWLRWKQ